MKKMGFRLTALIAFVILTLGVSQGVSASSILNAPQNYIFSENLKDAEVWGIDRKGYQKRGLWKLDRFLFPGVGVDAEVRSTVQKMDGDYEVSAIRFHSLSGIKRILEFDSVPPGGTLFLRYGIAEERGETEGVAYVNFRVWLGSQMLREVRIENMKQWQEIRIPLGIYSFLNRKGAFRFEIFSDNEDSIELHFDAEIKP